MRQFDYVASRRGRTMPSSERGQQGKRSRGTAAGKGSTRRRRVRREAEAEAGADADADKYSRTECETTAPGEVGVDQRQEGRKNRHHSEHLKLRDASKLDAPRRPRPCPCSSPRTRPQTPDGGARAPPSRPRRWETPHPSPTPPRAARTCGPRDAPPGHGHSSTRSWCRRGRSRRGSAAQCCSVGHSVRS